jgi:predicted secreted protein
MRGAIRSGAMRLAPHAVAALLLASFLSAAQADSVTHYNRIQLQAERQESVGNDIMHVTLSTFGEARDPAELAIRVNDDMEWALGIAKRYEGVTVGTGSYQTYPVYEENTLKRWRAQQNLELEGKDSRRMGQLVGELQARLQVKSMSFSVSEAKRTEVENRLIGQALDAFKTRAGIVGNNLRATGYRIVDISINTTSQRPPVPYPVGMMAAPMQAESRLAVETGESEVGVTVSGTVELTLP